MTRRPADRALSTQKASVSLGANDVGGAMKEEHA
jgi:hypothetical protein